MFILCEMFDIFISLLKNMLVFFIHCVCLMMGVYRIRIVMFLKFYWDSQHKLWLILLGILWQRFDKNIWINFL